MSEVSGTACLRPVRLGFVASSISLGVLRDASRLASGVWGGIYFPIFEADDPDLIRRAEALAVDVLHPLDDASATSAVANAPGFGWRGGAEWGPFGEASDGSIREGLLPVSRLIDLGMVDDWTVTWADDELGALYDVWFGRRNPVSDDSSASPAVGELRPSSRLIASSPIVRTGARIDYLGENLGLVIVIIGDDPADLWRFWNLRASGAQVLPWVSADPGGSDSALKEWLDDDNLVTRAQPVRRGDGKHLGPLVHVSAGTHQTEGVSVTQAIEQLGFTTSGDPGFRGGWRGDHPLATSIERGFSFDLDDDAWHVDVPLPDLPLQGDPSHWPGTIAAQVVVHRDSESAAGRTLSLPALRTLASPIERITRELERFHRPTGDGRALGVQANATSIRLSLMPTTEVFTALLPDGTTVGQSDDGRFATQFVDRLGGPNSMAASQPALRQVLYELSNADRSCPIARLINAALNSRGAWPDLISRQTSRDYATSVVYGLANTGLVVPTVEVRCPRCATDTDLRPEDLATEMRCAVCRAEFNLGLAIALQGPRNPWKYRLAAHLPPGRIRSGLAAMAANTVLRTAHRAGSAPAMPHLFGMTVDLEGWSCEIDVAALIPDGPITLAVVGEVKGGRETIDRVDIKNLQRVQNILRSTGIEAFILAGTTRPNLHPEEIVVLREACEAAPRRLIGQHHGLVLPIVLCAPDLSRHVVRRRPSMAMGHARRRPPGGTRCRRLSPQPRPR